MNHNSLITGINGFVATHLKKYLESQGDSVIGTTRDTIIDRNLLKECDCIYHLAANSSNKIGYTIMQENTMPLHLLLKYKQPHTKILYVSSSEIYGVSENSTELTKPSPNAWYGYAKYMGELMVTYSTDNYVIARPFNHTGIGQKTGFAIPNFIDKVNKADKYITVGNLHSTRDYLDVTDVCRAYHLLMRSGKGVYNVCSGKPTIMGDILDRIIGLSGKTLTIVPSGNPTKIYGNNDKIKALGWSAQKDIMRTVGEMYEYSTKN